MKKCFALLGFAFAALFAQTGDRYMSYDEFIRTVRAGRVQSVALDHFSSITGTAVENGQTNAFRSFGDTGTANDPLLLQLLKESGVPVSIQDRDKPNVHLSIISGVFFWVFPAILLLLLLRVNRKLNEVLKNQARQPSCGEARR